MRQNCGQVAVVDSATRRWPRPAVREKVFGHLTSSDQILHASGEVPGPGSQVELAFK